MIGECGGIRLKQGRGVEIVASYADQFYAGAAAVTRAKFGRGEVSYFGVCSEKPMVEAFVEGEVKRMSGRLKSESLPGRVHVARRGGVLDRAELSG